MRVVSPLALHGCRAGRVELRQSAGASDPPGPPDQPGTEGGDDRCSRETVALTDSFALEMTASLMPTLWHSPIAST